MDIPTRDRARRHRSPDIIDEELEFGDLLDFSEPFSWQMPRPSPHVAQSRITGRRALPEDRFRVHCSGFTGAGMWHAETIDGVAANSSPSAAPNSFTQPDGEALKADPEPSGGYMQHDGPFPPDIPMKEEPNEDQGQDTATARVDDFHASISYIADDGEIANISGIDLDFIEQRCPLLALAVEHSKSGPKLHLEALTTATADPFARYVLTGSYALNSSDFDIFACVPTSLLLHCQLYRLGVIYDLPDLRSQANVNIIRQCEFGCSSPDKPIELCAAISYAYEHLRGHKAVLDTIVSYCVSCFLQHRLDHDFEFCQLAYNLRPFHQDLCLNSRNRGFENETAAAIIQLPFEPLKPETYASREDINGKAYADVVHHFHGIDDTESLNKKRKRPAEFKLPMRPAVVNPFVSEEDPEEGAVTSPFSDLYEIGEAHTSRKRRASTITQPSIKSETDSEPEYEMVAGPPAVEELESEIESDVDSAEGVAAPRPGPTIAQQTSLPIRARPNGDDSSIATTNGSSHDSASDSEWSLV